MIVQPRLPLFVTTGPQSPPRRNSNHGITNRKMTDTVQYSETEIESDDASSSLYSAAESLRSPPNRTLGGSNPTLGGSSLDAPPLGAVRKPQIYDVLLGRGKRVRSLKGNQRFDAIIQQYAQVYEQALSREGKTAIAEEVINVITEKGQFLEFMKLPDSKGYWMPVDQRKVRQKVSHALSYLRRKKTGKIRSSSRTKLNQSTDRRRLYSLEGMLYSSCQEESHTTSLHEISVAQKMPGLLPTSEQVGGSAGCDVKSVATDGDLPPWSRNLNRYVSESSDHREQLPESSNLYGGRISTTQYPYTTDVRGRPCNTQIFRDHCIHSYDLFSRQPFAQQHREPSTLHPAGERHHFPDSRLPLASSASGTHKNPGQMGGWRSDELLATRKESQSGWSSVRGEEETTPLPITDSFRYFSEDQMLDFRDDFMELLEPFLEEEGVESTARGRSWDLNTPSNIHEDRNLLFR